MTTAPATADPPARMGSGAMFDTIADRYDLLNRLMSVGLDQSWRRKTVEALQVPAGGRVLDLATGTADLAIRIADRHPDRCTDTAPSGAGLDQAGQHEGRAARRCVGPTLRRRREGLQPAVRVQGCELRRVQFCG